MNRKNFLIFGLVVSLLLILTASKLPNDNLFQIAKNLDIFATLFKEVNTYYVDPIEPELLINSGIKGMLSSLDPYTDYIQAQNLDEYRTVTTGQYGGIGALVGQRNGQSVVIYPYEGYPAHAAGLMIGDVVTKIDDVDIEGKSNNETSKLLKGKSKTPVKLSIKRYGLEQEFQVELIRENITIKNVPFFGMVDNSTGYIKLSDFTTDAALEVRNAFKSLKNLGASNLILDLRGNPGGLLDQAIEIANLFVSKGSTIVSTKGKTGNWDQVYKAMNDPLDSEIPLVVLTDGSSASASEIVSGVIQDYDRGVLIGRRTFGKGLVQSTRSLPFDAQIKLTTAKYYIPSGRCIQAIDYSHKLEDGKSNAIPDSLKMPFKTQNNRLVFDGGGVSPDIEVIAPNYSTYVYQLVTGNIIFDFATEYFHQNIDNNIDPRTFKLPEQDFVKFSNWLQIKDFKYSSKLESQIQEIETKAKEEKYFDLVSSELNTLKKNIQVQKSKDLTRFKSEVVELLEQEIVTRYKLQSGLVEYTFSKDVDIIQALEVLSDSSRYHKLLTPRL